MIQIKKHQKGFVRFRVLGVKSYQQVLYSDTTNLNVVQNNCFLCKLLPDVRSAQDIHRYKTNYQTHLKYLEVFARFHLFGVKSAKQCHIWKPKVTPLIIPFSKFALWARKTAVRSAYPPPSLSQP